MSALVIRRTNNIADNIAFFDLMAQLNIVENTGFFEQNMIKSYPFHFNYTIYSLVA